MSCPKMSTSTINSWFLKFFQNYRYYSMNCIVIVTKSTAFAGKEIKLKNRNIMSNKKHWCTNSRIHQDYRPLQWYLWVTWDKHDSLYIYIYIYNSSFASHLWDNTEHVKESSDETENIPTMFSAEINLLWQLNRVWVSI